MLQVALAHQFDFLVFADEVYQLLGFDGVSAPPPPLCYYDTGEDGSGRVISMGSFAKILAPAMYVRAHASKRKCNPRVLRSRCREEVVE